MSDILTPDNIANVIIFLAPGYIARQLYRSVFFKKELGDTPTLITSAIYSLPIVTISKGLTDVIDNQRLRLHKHLLIIHPVWSDWKYLLLLLLITLIIGYGALTFRRSKNGRLLVKKLGFSSPEPTLYQGLMRVDHQLSVSTVVLKDGRTFGGIWTGEQTNDSIDTTALYFNRIRWLGTGRNRQWGPETQSSILVPIDSIQFIELGPRPVIASRTPFWLRLKASFKVLFPK